MGAKRFWADSRIGKLNGPDSVTLKHLFHRIGDAFDQIFGVPLSEFTKPGTPWLDGGDLDDDSVGGNHLVPSVTVEDGKALQSDNYDPGVEGWQITGDGNVEFNDGTFRGDIEVGNPASPLLINDDGITLPIATSASDDEAFIKWVDPADPAREIKMAAEDYSYGGWGALTLVGASQVQLRSGGPEAGGSEGQIYVTSSTSGGLLQGQLSITSGGGSTVTALMSTGQLALQATGGGSDVNIYAQRNCNITGNDGIRLQSRPHAASKHAAGLVASAIHPSNATLAHGANIGPTAAYEFLAGRLYKATLMGPAVNTSGLSVWQLVLFLGASSKGLVRWQPIQDVYGRVERAEFYFQHTGTAQATVQLQLAWGAGTMTFQTLGFGSIWLLVEDIGPI